MTREQAIEIIQELWRYKETDKYTEAEIRQALAMATKALGQEPKTGHWMDREVYDADRWKCSECGRTEPYKENYCPNCGADMMG